MGGGGAHILGSPMLFVPFTVPTFPATHHQTTHPAHQTHHQQLQATTQNPVQQPQQLTQLNQLSHLNHQGIVPATTNQPTIHSTSCSPQQQATTPNKVKRMFTSLFRHAFSPGLFSFDRKNHASCCAPKASQRRRSSYLWMGLLVTLHMENRSYCIVSVTTRFILTRIA